MKNEASSARSFKFPKSEKLHSKILIDKLFKEGESFFLHPFKVLYLVDTSGTAPNNQVLITASAKKFKRAVDRNLIKRRIRESYRLNKHLLQVEKPKKGFLLIAYIYVGKEICQFDVINSKLIHSLQRLKSQY